MFKIAIAAEHEYTDGGRFGPWYDDNKLRMALEARGHQVEIINWEDPKLDITQFNSVFVSTTWNACDKPQQYINWLNNCERDNRQRLINDLTVIQAGFIKYLYWEILEQFFTDNPEVRDLGRLIPSKFYQNIDSSSETIVNHLAGRTLSNILTELEQDVLWNQENIVIKPVISGDGKDTFVYNRFKREIPIDKEKRAQFVLEDIEQAEAIFHRLAADTIKKGVILQTYMSGVEKGEYSLVILDQKCTHAIQKPKRFKGDNSRLRRFIPLAQLPKEVLYFAEKIVGLLEDKFGSGSISRARVDLFLQDETPVLCELECVEPNTNLRVVAEQNIKMADEIVKNYAKVIEKRTAVLSF